MWKTVKQRAQTSLSGRPSGGGLRFWLVFLCLALGCAEPVSANIYTRCVQEQLTVLGHDPGPADGVIGQRTRAALERLMAQTPRLRRLPPLDQRFAVTWCREIAQARPRARKVLPRVQRERILADGDGEKGNRQRSIVAFTAREVAKFYAEQMDGVLASPLIVVASGKPHEALDRMQAEQRRLGVQVANRWLVAPRCADTSQHTGFATRHVMVLCLKPAKRYDEAWVKAERRHLAYLIAHEFFHVVQAELAADKVPQRFRIGAAPPPRRTRPTWMVEGTADYFALLFMAHHFGKAQPIDKVFKAAEPHRQTLSSIAAKPYVARVGDYPVSALAASLLAQRHGSDALIEYWKLLGRGIAPKPAFKKVSGQSMAAFEKEFERMRKSLKAVKAY